MLWFNPLQNYAAVVNKSLLRNDRGWGIPIPGITHTSSLNIHMNYDVCKWNQIDVLRFFFNSQGFETLNGSIKFIYWHFIEDAFLLWVTEIMLNSLFLLQKNNSMILVTNIINNVKGASDLVVIRSHKTYVIHIWQREGGGGLVFATELFSYIHTHVYGKK